MTPRPLRVNEKFLNPFKLICPVQSRAKKESGSHETQISPRTCAIPARKRGVSRSSRTLGWAAVDAKALGACCGSQGGFSRERSLARRTNGAVADGKTVWSWHPWLVSSRRRFAKLNRAMRAANSPATEARGIRLRGEHGISRQTIAQGRPDAPADTCMLVCVFSALIAHETAGASQHPAFPAPSDFWGALKFPQTSGAIRVARRRVRMYPRHCERSEAIHRAAPPQPSSPGLTGRSSIPETSVTESRSRGVLDAPPSRGMTSVGGASHLPYPGGGGSARMSAAKRETGWGDLSTRAPFAMRDRHPTPPRRALRSRRSRERASLASYPSRGG